MLLIHLVWQSVQVGSSLDGLVEGCVKYSHLADARECMHTGSDAHQVGRIVKRGQFSDLFDASDDVLVYEHRSSELLATVDDPMPDGLYFVEA